MLKGIMVTSQAYFYLVSIIAVVQIFSVSSIVAQSTNRAVEVIKKNRRELLNAYVAKVLEIKSQAESKDLTLLSQEMTPLLSTDEKSNDQVSLLHTSIIKVKRLPNKVQGEISQDYSPAEYELRKELKLLNVNLAGELFTLSQAAKRSKSPSLMFELILESLKYHADFKEAREILGYVSYEGSWVTPFERDQLRIGRVNHPQYGWLPSDQVTKYEQGERYFKTRWVTKEKEFELRSDFKNPWEIKTENFLIKTNTSLERGVAVSRVLEDFYYFFRCVCTAYYHLPEQTGGLLGSTGMLKSNAARYEIHLYKNKQEYVSALKSKIEQKELIEQSNGFYYPKTRIAYFFAQEDEEAFWQTLFHEATHQFMYECSSGDRVAGEHNYFWPVEGVACYMESYQHSEHELVVGDPKNIRFRYARHYLLDEMKHTPLKEFSVLGALEYQRAGSLDHLQYRYAYGSGLAHFFMHYGDGVYRDAFLIHLSHIYSNKTETRHNTPSLAELTGVSYLELDGQYHKYMQEQRNVFEQGRKQVEVDVGVEQ